MSARTSVTSWGWLIVAVALLGVAVVVTVARPERVIAGDSRAYVEAAESLRHGSYEAPSEPTGVPRYPPGFPIVLAPFVWAGGDDGARAVSAVLGCILVVLVWAAAARIGGLRAAAVAAVLWIASPMLTDYSTEVMSDPVAAASVLVALLAALSGRWVWAGLALGWSSWCRLIHVVFLVGLGRRRHAWLAAAAVLVPLAAFQLQVYGRLAGYDGGQAQFSLDYVTQHTPLLFMDRPSPWPNWQFFPGILAGLEGGLVPLLPLFAGVELVARRGEAAARLAACVIAGNVAVYLPYFYQAARFMLPAACLVVVFAAAGAVRLVDHALADRREAAALSA